MMEHLLAKTVLITKISEIVANECKVDLDKARDVIYFSGVAEMIEDDETGLYGESPLYIYSIYKNKIFDYIQNNK